MCSDTSQREAETEEKGFGASVGPPLKSSHLQHKILSPHSFFVNRQYDNIPFHLQLFLPFLTKTSTQCYFKQILKVIFVNFNINNAKMHKKAPTEHPSVQ